MGKPVLSLTASALCLLAQDVRKVHVQQIPGQAPLEHVEILGVGAGKFDPALWQSGRLNWAPDVRVPFLAPRQGGLYRNIYAPSVIQEPYGWRLFYGAPLPADRYQCGEWKTARVKLRVAGSTPWRRRS